jgi:hypothetical protein
VQEIGGKKVPAKDVFHAGRSTVYLPNLRWRCLTCRICR